MYGRNPHHIMEAIFKALAKALDQSTMVGSAVGRQGVIDEGDAISPRVSFEMAA